MDEDAIGFLPEVARRTHGYVGADLMELVRQAGLTALRRAAGRGFTALKSAGSLSISSLQRMTLRAPSKKLRRRRCARLCGSRPMSVGRISAVSRR